MAGSAIVLAGCAATGAHVEGSEPPGSGALVTVTDEAGDPVAGATVYWAAPGYPTFSCEADARPLPGGYTFSGEETTDATGAAWLPVRGAYRDRRYQVQVVGPGGQRTLSSLGTGETRRELPLLSAVEVELGLRCGGDRCGEVEGHFRIVRDGGTCERHLLQSATDRLELARVPQGELELTLRADRGTPKEGLAVYRRPLASDLREVIDLAIIGGPHELAGSVQFDDGAPPGGQPYFTNVQVECENGLGRIASPEPATGAFRIEALPAVPCTITATHSGTREGYFQAPPTQVSPDTAGLLTITLQQTSPD